MELARGIEPPTCGLQNLESATSDNLTPQETTEEESGTVAADGASLSCPGSSVVADCDDGSERVEASTAPETIDLDLLLSFRSQSLTGDQEAGEEPMKPCRAR